MGAVGASGAASGAAAAAIIQAVKASGAIVRVEPHAFMSIVLRQESPLIVIKEGGSGLFSGKYQYITSYKGLAFHTKSADPLQFTGNPELVVAKSIWIPG